MSFCTECQPLGYCRAIRAINEDAAATEGIVENSQGIINLWNTSKEDREKYRLKIEEVRASHENFKQEWRQKATTMLCPNLDDLP